MKTQVNIYLAFYKGQKKEVHAATTFEAQTMAAKLFKAKKNWEVTIMLVEKNGQQIIHQTNII